MNGFHGVTAFISLPFSFTAFSAIVVPSFRRVSSLINFRNRCAKGYFVILPVPAILFCNVEKLFAPSLAEVHIRRAPVSQNALVSLPAWPSTGIALAHRLLQRLETMIEVRFHGRGGQGAKISSRILGRSAFLAGLEAQDFAIFGAERRGAPVVSCTRLSEQPIDERGYIDTPDLVVVMDHTLLKEARRQVVQGVGPATPLLINGSADSVKIPADSLPTSKILFIDLSVVARRLIGRPFVSAASAAAAAKLSRLISLEPLVEAARLELAESGMTTELIDKNLAAARAVYALTPLASLAGNGKPHRAPSLALEAIAECGALEFTGPTIRRGATSAMRETGSWRMERPEIDLRRCKRCFLCYLYCPESAMRLDSENYPHIDYEHCKGCMICCTECPTNAIAATVEA
jgi:pyruvate ferredoxin oxidoreductase gamma subunit